MLQVFFFVKASLFVKYVLISTPGSLLSAGNTSTSGQQEVGHKGARTGRLRI